MPGVVTAGELLVEIMRVEEGVPFDEPATFRGPFPSGAPAIFADAVARLGRESGIIGTVGDDGFGRCILNRLERDGVDVSAVRTVSDVATGVAFVTYFADDSREFIFHMGNSAAGRVDPTGVRDSLVSGVDAVHLNGSSLAMGEPMRELCYGLADAAASDDRLLSLDPNLRLELGGIERSRERIAPVLGQATVVTPTAEELRLLTGIDTRADAVEELLDGGVDLVAVKQGADGCRLYTRSETVSHPGFDVDVVDPTGAGDAFSAAAVVGRLEGMGLDTLAAFANAAGARAVSAKGPMEGLAARAAVEDLLRA